MVFIVEPARKLPSLYELSCLAEFVVARQLAGGHGHSLTLEVRIHGRVGDAGIPLESVAAAVRL